MRLPQCGVLLGVVLMVVCVRGGNGWEEKEDEKEGYSLAGERGNSSWDPGHPGTWICYSTAGSESPRLSAHDPLSLSLSLSVCRH